MILVEGKGPEIPDYVPSPVQRLLTDCRADDPDERPTFDEIVDRLIKMKFKLTENVNSAKLLKFVEGIQEREMLNFSVPRGQNPDLCRRNAAEKSETVSVTK
jgi:hypothetical protein